MNCIVWFTNNHYFIFFLQIAVFTPIDNDWLNKIMHTTLIPNDDSYDYRKSNLSSAQNQYLPPV